MIDLGTKLICNMSYEILKNNENTLQDTINAFNMTESTIYKESSVYPFNAIGLFFFVEFYEFIYTSAIS